MNSFWKKTASVFIIYIHAYINTMIEMCPQGDVSTQSAYKSVKSIREDLAKRAVLVEFFFCFVLLRMF